jgi:hypothetical protein
MAQKIVEGGCYHLPHPPPEQRIPSGEVKTVRPTFKPLAYALIVLLMGALAAGGYVLFTDAPFGACSIGSQAEGWPVPGCENYLYSFVGAPIVVGLLLLLLLPNFVTSGAAAPVAQPTKAPAEPKKAAPPPPPKPTTDAAVQLLSLLQREGRLVDFLREDIQPYDDAQIGAAVRAIHESCRQVLAEHLTLEQVLSGNEGDEVTVPQGFDPSAIRLTGNVAGEPPFRGALRHAGWRASQVKLPAQPAGQDPRIVAPAEVEIP